MQATYEAGDHVGVLAENEASIVDRAAAALGLSPSLIFNIRCPAGNPHQLPVPFPSEPPMPSLTLNIRFSSQMDHKTSTWRDDPRFSTRGVPVFLEAGMKHERSTPGRHFSCASMLKCLRWKRQ